MKVLDRVVLASGSPRRLELLRSLGFAVTVTASGYDEPPMPHLRPVELAAAHAAAKLASVPRDGVAVIASDTVVDLDGAALGKPVDADDATRILRALSGREHVVHTAYAVALPGIAAPVGEVASTRVRFHALSDDEIAEYVATGEPMDKAGAYGIQGYGATIVERVDGDYFSVMGLALGTLISLCRELGLRYDFGPLVADA